ncbi:hypothetical protein EI94DRAFT_1586634 [Lactarius quietus]|nr:hypothetical protein EI94DRAFT_1586634 [Lactarius quietus]
MSKKWDAPIYIFFKPSATIEYVGRWKAHVFECMATCCHCKTKFVWHFLYSSNTSLTSNLRQHARMCWGDDVVLAADKTGNVEIAHEVLSKQRHTDGSITSAFKWVGKGKVTYSQHAHTKMEACAEFIHWVNGYIPSADILARDVKDVFISICNQIAGILQDYKGKLNFATDAWTLLNHKAYVAITVHLARSGKPLSMLLDIIEVLKSHNGYNLAITFAEVLQTFRIVEKV